MPDRYHPPTQQGVFRWCAEDAYERFAFHGHGPVSVVECPLHTHVRSCYTARFAVSLGLCLGPGAPHTVHKPQVAFCNYFNLAWAYVRVLRTHPSNRRKRLSLVLRW